MKGVSEFFQCSASVSSLLVVFDFAIAIATVAAAAGQFQSFSSEPTFAVSFISSLVLLLQKLCFTFYWSSWISWILPCTPPVLPAYTLPTGWQQKLFRFGRVSVSSFFSPLFSFLFHSIKHVWRLGVSCACKFKFKLITLQRTLVGGGSTTASQRKSRLSTEGDINIWWVAVSVWLAGWLAGDNVNSSIC